MYQKHTVNLENNTSRTQDLGAAVYSCDGAKAESKTKNTVHVIPFMKTK